MNPPRRKPTKGDLIALVNLAAHEAGSALTDYWNDRDQSRASTLETRLNRVQALILRAASHFPPPRKSPWVEEADNGQSVSSNGQNSAERVVEGAERATQESLESSP